MRVLRNTVNFLFTVLSLSKQWIYFSLHQDTFFLFYPIESNLGLGEGNVEE